MEISTSRDTFQLDGKEYLVTERKKSLASTGAMLHATPLSGPQLFFYHASLTVSLLQDSVGIEDGLLPLRALIASQNCYFTLLK